MSKHTPGPWQINASDVNEICIFVPSELGSYVLVERVGGQVHKGEDGKFSDYSEVVANAFLMLAAPDLLAAANAVIGNTPPAGQPGHVDFGAALAMLREAIAKAEGA